MAFVFDWDLMRRKEVVASIQKQINEMIRSDKDAEEVGKAYLTELSFGTEPPHLEIDRVYDVGETHGDMRFRFKYSGDASVTFYTRVELNALSSEVSERVGLRARGSRHACMMDAHNSLSAPIYIKLSKLRVDGRVRITYEKPFLTVHVIDEVLKSVQVNSSFDGCPAAASVQSAVTDGLFQAVKKLVASPLKFKI